MDRLAAVTAAAGLALTGAFVLVDDLRFAYYGPEWDLAIEVASAFSAVLAAVLVTQRFRRSGSWLDLLLATGLGVLALRALAFGVVPKLVDEGPGGARIYASLVSAATGTGLLAVGAVRRDRGPVPASWRRGVWLVPPLVVGGAVLVLAALGVDGPPVTARDLDPTASTTPDWPHFTGTFALTALATVAASVAALGFARRSRRRGDDLLGWVAMAAALFALSRLNYALYPSTRYDWVFTGDVFVLASFAALLVGSLREIAAYQPRLMRAAVVEERRRMARDLHDGVAQELAFIVALARTREEEGRADEDLAALGRAAERALDESRAAILALGRPGDAPLRALLHDALADVSARSGAALRLDVPAELRVPEATAEALLRIAREAVSNATRHGGARSIAVRVRADGHLDVRIRDDGRGFDPSAVGALDGMGLAGMEERARVLGGAMRLESAPGRGTEVRLRLP